MVGGISSSESIPGLLKRLQIRALNYSWSKVFFHFNKYNTEQFECQSRLVGLRVNVIDIQKIVLPNVMGHDGNETHLLFVINPNYITSTRILYVYRIASPMDVTSAKENQSSGIEQDNVDLILQYTIEVNCCVRSKTNSTLKHTQ